MHISGYANMVLKHVSFDELVRLYGEWIVGVGEFGRSRSSRLKNGIPKELEAKNLSSRLELVDEEKRSQLRIRAMADRWICHWIHGDAGKPDRSWNNVIEVARTGKDVLLVALWPLLASLEDGYPFEDTHASIARDLAARGVTFVDTLPALRGAPTRSLWVHEVDHHPNAEGHRRFAEAITSAVREALARTAPTGDSAPP